MTKYSFSGTLVDIKATNLHGSAQPKSGTMSADNTGATTKISVGTIVMADATDATLVDNATAAAANKALGVAIETRSAGDSRLVSYTYFGHVRVMAASAVAVGDGLKVVDGGKVDNGTLGSDRLIGRALTAATNAGDIIEAFVFFGQ